MTTVKESIKFDQVRLDLKDWPRERYEESRTKLSGIKEREREKRKRAAAVNSLETFLFEVRDKLESDEFIKCSTEEEREKVRAKADEVDTWLSDADNSVELKAFQDKLAELKSASRDVYFRMNEKKLRPKRLDELKEVLNKSIDFLESTRNLTGAAGEDKPITEVEWNTLDKLITTVKVTPYSHSFEKFIYWFIEIEFQKN